MENYKPIPDLKVQPMTYESRNYVLIAKKWLRSNYDLRYNVVLSRTEFKLKDECEFKQLDERTVNSWYTQFKEKRCMLSKKDWERLLLSEFVDIFDPFKEYFKGLPKWDDNVDYILQLSETIQTSNPELWYKHLSKWIVGTVANAIQHGENHLALVFSGSQGVGKTRWLNKLVPASLSEYTYCGSLDPNNKDSKVLLAECLLINLDELEVTSSKEMASLKSMMTLKSIRERKAYRADAETLPRRASFVGSVNNPTFLLDPSGSRRFLCHSVSQIALQHEVDMDKVYAQGYSMLKNGFIYYFTKEDQDELEQSNLDFKVITMEQELISKYYFPGTDRAADSVYMNASTLIKDLISKGESVKVDKVAMKAFGSALTTMKFPKVKREGNYVYVLEPRTASEIYIEEVELPLSIAC
jgi:predicted P-loop ATPase